MIHFKHQQRRKYFALADFVSVCLAIGLALQIRRYVPLPIFQGLLPPGSTGGFDSLTGPTFSLASLFVVTQYVLGMYDLWQSVSLTVWMRRLLPTNIFLVGIAFSYLYLTQNFQFPRSLLAAVFFTNYVITVAWRKIYFHITSKTPSDVVLVGTLNHVGQIAKEFNLPPYVEHIKVKAAFLVDISTIMHAHGHTLFPISAFDEYSQLNPYQSVILTPSGYHQQLYTQILGAARRGVPIYAIPTVYEILLGRLNHFRINDMPLLELRVNPPSDTQQVLKRSFDIVLATVLLNVMTVPMLAVALLIKLTSPGHILFKQKRIGRDGRPFTIFKFRTMVDQADKLYGIYQAKKTDPRITKIGRWLRVTRMDELPQLINIIRGDMSFIGPRPLVEGEVSKYEAEVTGFRERTRIRPGVTGLAQVSGGYETSPDIKLKYDLAYVANQNMTLDLQILFRTVKTVLTRAGQ
jgi:exopolysaccharide biosynthesis polyprenyl glycosylphosphotransferase